MNKPTPKIYCTTNWSSYDRALINRGNISIWFDPSTQWYAQPQGKQGRNQTLKFKFHLPPFTQSPEAFK